MKNQYLDWVLRIGVFGEFFGHGMFALRGEEEWIGWVQQLSGVDVNTATQMLFFVGLIDITIALVVLIKPLKPVLLYATFWGFLTAFVRPLVGEGILDFVEEWTNWAAPLALYLLRGKGKK